MNRKHALRKKIDIYGKKMLLSGLLCLTLAGCGKVDQIQFPVKIPGLETYEYTTPDGTGLAVDMSKFSKNAKLLTAADIYVRNAGGGYLSSGAFDGLIIENEAALKYARERYCLEMLPDDIEEKYPIADYTYIIKYREVGSSGYSLQAGALLVDVDTLNFVMTENSHGPLTETVCDVMDGFIFLAIVPDGTLLNDHYRNWTYPADDDVMQDLNFECFPAKKAWPTTELYQIYGETDYLIENEEQYQIFADMAAGLIQENGRPAGDAFLYDVDFKEVSLLYRFYRYWDESNGYYSFEQPLNIDGDTITIHFEEDPQGDSTRLFYAAVPKKYLTSDSYQGWVTLEALNPEQDKSRDDADERTASRTVDREKLIAEMMSSYSGNAKFYDLKADSIFSSVTEYDKQFVGRYSISCMEDEMQLYVASDDYGLGQDGRFYRLTTDNYREENHFFVQYIPETEENSDITLLGLVVDGNRAEFLYYDRNAERNYVSSRGGKCIGFYAAIPMEDLTTAEFDGWTIPLSGLEGDHIEEGYVAVFRGGLNHEKIHETFVYKTDSGYRYVSTYYEDLSVEYDRHRQYTITESGEAETKAEVLEAAKRNEAAVVARIPGEDDMLFFVEKFLENDAW